MFFRRQLHVLLVVKEIIDNYNKRILTASIQIDNTATAAAATIDNNKTCNCRQKNTCPLDGNCLQSSVIYQATVTRQDNNTTETYMGLAENNFKTRYRSHIASFRHSKHRNSTELSKHIWTLKDNKTCTTTSNTLFPGTFSHRTRPTLGQAKDVTSASKKNS